MKTLDELAISYNTDKSSLYHDYTKMYNFIFRDLREEKLTLLEIGVLDGASINMWHDFFQNAQVVGVDVDPRCKAYAKGRIHIEIGNQTDPGFLNGLAETYLLDIIIDDGGHAWNQQKTTFKHLFPHLNNGGFYVIEDLTTSYLKGSVWDTGGRTTVEFLKRLVDHTNLNGKSIVGTKELAGKEINYYESTIEYMLFYKGLCIIKKRREPLKPVP